MAKKTFRAEEIINKLREAEVLTSQAKTVSGVCRAPAIVTDIGGPFSHSSIVAHKCGIPAVLAAGNGMHRFQDGQIITVDGSTGLVMIVK